MIHGLSFDIEEHFQVAAFDSLVRRRHWESFESRVERNTHLLLDLLDAHGIKATMFVVGWVAERHPGLVKALAQAGHEIGCHSYAHELISVQTPQQFREDIRRTKRLLEDLTGHPVWGYRAPTFSITKETEWALAILVEEGYRYDSSIVPIVHDLYGIPGASPTIHLRKTQSGEMWEVPPTTCRIGPLRLSVAGGGYFRLFPYPLFRGLLARVERQGHPLIMYFHPWEFDPEQPRMRGSWLSRFRHYHNLDQTMPRLRKLLAEFSFGPIHKLIPDVMIANGAPSLSHVAANLWGKTCRSH